MSGQLADYLEFHFDLSARIDAFKALRQYSVELELTNRCNLSCRYCYASANQAREELGAATVTRLLPELQQCGIREIGWIGGEPLLLEQLPQWMETAAGLGFKNVLYSNGVLLDRERAARYRELCGTGRIILHLDSVVYENWAAGQLHPSVEKHERIIAAFDHLLAAGYPGERIILSVPLSRPCYETVEATLRFAAERGISFVNLIPLTPLGRSDDPQQFITPRELWHAMELRAEILQRPWLIGLGIGEYCKQFQMTDCTVNYRGELLPYIDCFQPVGNIHREPVADLFDRHGAALALAEWCTPDSLQNRMGGHCGVCEYSAYCFGNPVSRPSWEPGEPDHDCVLNRADQ